jgi:hypothetical protein
MKLKQPAGAEALVAPLYFVAFLLIATSALDFVLSIVPLRTGDVQWRFASLGLLSGFLLTPLLGVALTMGVAQWARHARVQRLLAIVNLSLTVFFVILFVAFILDVFQLRGIVQPDAEEAFAAAAIKAAVKYLSFIVALGWLSRIGFLMSRPPVTALPKAPTAVLIG